MGNEKGSAIKLLILFQELILNAVKYSGFVEKQERLLRIHFSSDAEQLLLKVQNRFNPTVKVKTSGIGHVIIENFAELLNTKPIIDKDNNMYSIVITFKNFWNDTEL